MPFAWLAFSGSIPRNDFKRRRAAHARQRVATHVMNEESAILPAQGSPLAPIPLRACQALLAIAAIKLAILVLDTNPRFFLWDSVTYLRGATEGLLPRDRSFLYSFLIRATAMPAHSLHALVIVQTLAGIASAFLVYFMLRRFFALHFLVALCAALLVAIEPGQLFYERMLMAEAPGGMLWLGFITLALAYMRDGKTFWLPLVCASGLLMIAFRLNGTASVLLVGSLLPLWRMLVLRGTLQRDSRREQWRRTFMQLAVTILFTVVTHAAYRELVGSIAHAPPGYIGTEGLFLLGYVAPAVQENDFAGTGCDSQVLQHVQLPLRDPRRREQQLWKDGGLWSVMQRDCPQPEAAAGVVAHRAFDRIAPDIVPMALTTQAQYFDGEESTWRMNSDLGRKGMLPLELIEPVSRLFFLDAKPIAFTDTPTSLWFEHSRWWLAGCFLLSPLCAIWLVVQARRRTYAAVAWPIALCTWILFTTQFLFSPIISFRYLHPFPPLVIVCVIAGFALRIARSGPLAALDSPARSTSHDEAGSEVHRSA
jgi:hypothetical protein